MGCCCCTGDCLYKSCPPCPCPAPIPNHTLDKCPLQKIKDRYVSAYNNSIHTLKDYSVDPAATQSGTGDSFHWKSSDGWTSGFFPGLLWQLANATALPTFAAAARSFTAGREHWKTKTSTHDIGFVIFDSFGKGLELGATPNKTYRDVVVTAAHSLAQRYNPKVRMLRSWGNNDDEKSFEVIIDNLLNLELLFWAARESGNQTLRDIAFSHALRTGEVWVREDGSTPHLCVFDPLTGALKSPCTGTPQGLSANSTWARGQAWATYGFTMAHRYTGEPRFLAWARQTADFYLHETIFTYRCQKTGACGVPAWDYLADNITAPAYPDTSAAAITASALLELGSVAQNATYKRAAYDTMRYIMLGRDGLLADPHVSPAVLAANQHDCGAAECTVIETDYFFFEALRRLGTI